MVRNAPILVVDDNPASARLAQVMLRRRGLSAMVAIHGQQALRLAGKCPPRAVLMDFEMPRWRGPSVLSMLRQRPGFESLVVVAYTASLGIDKRAAQSMGFDGLICKPVNEREFHAEFDRLNLMSRSPAYWLVGS